MSWKKIKLGELLTESRIPAIRPDTNKRIKVKLKVLGVEKRPIENEKEGATKQFERKRGQFIYGRQNFHKGAFGIVPDELDGFESSADLPAFDVRGDCLATWLFYFFKIGNRYLELEKLARGVGSKRIHPEQLSQIEIPLPSIEEQKHLISKFRRAETQSSEISNEFTHQLHLLKQLRQAFLREALQGKLVVQDLNDESGSELLTRIKTEKMQLIRERKIRKEKELPKIGAEEIPFEIPKNWTWCRLGEIALSISTGPFGTMLHKSDYVENGIPLVNPMNIIDERIVASKKMMINERTRERLSNYILKKDDIVLGRRGEMGRCAIVTEDENGWLCGTGSFFLRIHSVIDKQYFIKYLSSDSAKSFLLNSSVGSTMDNLNHKILNSLVFPLAPLSEQVRIVTKLKQLMEYCGQLEQSIRHSQIQIEQLLQQLLREALQPKGKHNQIDEINLAAEH